MTAYTSPKRRRGGGDRCHRRGSGAVRRLDGPLRVHHRAGRKLPPYPAELAGRGTPRERLPKPGVAGGGCRVAKNYIYAGASDAAIVSGLVALVLRVYSGRPRAEILATPAKFLHDLGLIAALSTNRGNGVAAMVEKSGDSKAAV